MFAFSLPRSVLTLTPLMLLAACGDLPGFQVNAKQETFTPTYSINDKVDLLFMVDNSGSMAAEQAGVAASFDSFIEQFSSRNLQFHIGVITTDSYTNTSWWNSSTVSNPYYHIPNNGPGSLLAKLGNDKIITPTSLNFATQFKQNVALGTGGSGAETGLLAITLALGTQAVTGGWNADFLRPDAFLGVIVVSDEDESVGNSDATPIKHYPAQMATRLDNFESTLRGVKESGTDLIRMYSIVAPSVAECPTSSTEGVGTVYIEAARRFNGTVTNLCSDFSSALIDIGGQILQAASRFKLVQPPVGDITVRVNGVKIAESDTNGWVYLTATQEIEFRGAAIPKSGEKISVEFVPAKPIN